MWHLSPFPTTWAENKNLNDSQESMKTNKIYCKTVWDEWVCVCVVFSSFRLFIFIGLPVWCSLRVCLLTWCVMCFCAFVVLFNNSVWNFPIGKLYLACCLSAPHIMSFQLKIIQKSTLNGMMSDWRTHICKMPTYCFFICSLNVWQIGKLFKSSNCHCHW